MNTSTFAALVLSLPSKNKTVRMRIWRALHGIGCGVLRDGVYLLPSGAAGASRLVELESEVKAAGGFAMTVELNLKSSAQVDWARKLFDRTSEYASLIARIGAARKSVTRLGQPRADTLIKRLRRSLEEILKTDFYPGQASKQALDALAGLESAVQGHFSPGEPHRAKSGASLGLAQESMDRPPGKRLAHQALHRSQGAVQMDRQTQRSTQGRDRIRF
jgi:hypothetical protein